MSKTLKTRNRMCKTHKKGLAIKQRAQTGTLFKRKCNTKHVKSDRVM